LKRLLVLAAAAGGLLAWRERKLVANEQRYGTS
jgi:hypothetical protein